jgi:hypothetical protein
MILAKRDAILLRRLHPTSHIQKSEIFSRSPQILFTYARFLISLSALREDRNEVDALDAGAPGARQFCPPWLGVEGCR